MSNPWDSAPIVRRAGAATAGNPKLPLELTHSAGANALQNAELGRQPDINTKTRADAAKALSDAARAAADARTAAPLNAAQLTKAQADAVLAQQKVDETKANQALSTMAANSNVHGDAYLKAHVPPSMWNVVKAYARGDLGSRSGGLSTSMLPIIQHAMNYDPSASGVNFPARVKMQADLASGNPQSAGGQLQAFERMLLHGENVLDSGLKLNNFHSGFLSSVPNGIRAFMERRNQDPTLARFNKQVENYAPESEKAIAGGLGSAPERQSRAEALSGSESPETIIASLQGDAQQALGAMQAVNDRYKRLMGRDIIDALSPQAKAAYNKIMAGGIDPKTGKPMHPAEGFVPLGGSGDGGVGGAGGGGGGPLPGATPATGATKAEGMPPETAAAITGMIKRGMSAQQINSVLVPAGLIGPEGLSEETIAQARKTIAAGGSLVPQFEKPTTLKDRVINSPTGTFVGSAVDAGMGGFSDELAGLINGDTAGYNAAKQANFAANRKSSIAGSTVGSVGDMLLGGGLLKGTALAASLGRAAPYAGGAAYSALQGAGQDNDNRVDGLGLGAVTGLLGTAGGQALSVPLGAMARTAPALAVNNGVRRMFGGRTIAPVSALSPAERDYSGALLKAGPDNVRDFLGRASDLGVPASPADAAAELTSLGGQAVRRSPTAAQTAENAFLPRARGQIDRFGSAVTRDLGPVANIPQLSQDLTQQGQVAAAPLYEQAYAAPGASSVKLDDLASRPSMKAGLARAYSIAQEEGRDPRVLGFDLNGQGEVTLNKVPSFQTLDYVKRGLDDTLEQHRDPITGRLQLNEATRAINNTKNALLGRVDEVNPAYAAARKAYAGPVQARDALAMGQDSFSLSPDELALQAQGQSPDNLAQMQLGQRSALMARANKVRDVSNPFEATLGTPNARSLIETLHPNNPGTANLFATRDMEGQIARSANDILGNSKTAQRQIADQAFAGANIGDMAGAAVDLAHGGLPVSTIAKAGLTRAGMFAAGKRAVSKADALAPMVFDTDPNAARATLDDLLARLTARNQYVQQMRPTYAMGVLGAGAANGLSGY